ncbi:MAG TPA: (2Fe-2S)-binding protein [Pseudonocardia sp.]|uniref:(2Fe-2S)-binding protein n=1 Tax=Pseudonocardia sp. TaxID=60912 RepID=UPI002BC33C1E|nr:(2Fe-2S)-binding protein [Pseudonocardia sp.]HTF46680.1 (2Fe-2S)-binding protein [Pseudonocardia sp.]
MIEVRITVNGTVVERSVEPRLSLADFLRDQLGLTGTHLGCEHGVCGACSVLLDGRSVRACLTLAVQADGHRVTTVEGLASCATARRLSAELSTRHGLQCGFCTAGFLVTATELIQESAGAELTEPTVRAALSGNLCRCTGYQAIIEAVRAASRPSAPPEVDVVGSP